MKLRASTPIFLLSTLLTHVACGDSDTSSSSTNSGAGGVSAGGAQPGGGGASGGSGGEGGAQTSALEQAVRSTNWAEIEGAPSVSGGAKQDDIFFVDAQRGWVASGPLGEVLATTDGGATWESVLSGDGAFFRAVHFTSPSRGFAGNIGAGLSPGIDDPTLLFETSDGGANWTPVTNVTGSDAKGICNLVTVDETILGVGRANGPAHLLRSDDDGASWVSKDLGDWLSMAIDAHFATPDEGLVVGMGSSGQRCTVVRTEDGGDSFTQVFESEINGSLCWKVDFPTPDVGYVAILETAGGPGRFAKTTDGGATWAELPLPGDDAYPALAAGFISADIGWMAPESANIPVYRTFDGGATWEPDPTLKGPINRFRFVDAKTAYAVGAKVWKLELP
jgi:photosystem II stability/assembly factor-like uncharacterized protein